MLNKLRVSARQTKTRGRAATGGQGAPFLCGAGAAWRAKFMRGIDMYTVRRCRPPAQVVRRMAAS